MTRESEIESLKAEIKALRTEVKDLKEFVKAMYGMLGEDEEYESSEYSGGAELGRYNT